MMYTFKKNFDAFNLSIDNLEIIEHLFIYGKNGSGKSTLLKLMAGHLSGNQALPLSLYFHDPDIGLYAHATGLDNLKLFNASLVDLEDWTRECPLFKKALMTSVNNMSLGMKKIIKLYLYFSRDTCFLLLDEVFSNFDPETITFLIHKIKTKHNCITIMTGHEEHKIFKSLKIEDGHIVN